MWPTILGIILVAHGIGHSMGFLEAWTAVPAGFSDAPWIFGGEGIESPVGKVFGLVWLLAMLLWVAAGGGLIARQTWWAPLAIGAAVLSLIAILPWWNTVVDGARFGATLVDLGMLALLVLPWKEQVRQVLG